MKRRNGTQQRKTTLITRIVWTVVPIASLVIGILIWSHEPAHGTNITVYESPT